MVIVSSELIFFEYYRKITNIDWRTFEYPMLSTIKLPMLKKDNYYNFMTLYLVFF